MVLYHRQQQRSNLVSSDKVAALLKVRSFQRQLWPYFSGDMTGLSRPSHAVQNPREGSPETARGSMKESQLRAVLPSSTFPAITHSSILTLTPWDYLHQRHGKCCPSTSPEAELSNHV